VPAEWHDSRELQFWLTIALKWLMMVMLMKIEHDDVCWQEPLVDA
jgi:hypothetical protein